MAPEDQKAYWKTQHLESFECSGFSEDEAGILREYEGSKGKKVIRKVIILFFGLSFGK